MMNLLEKWIKYHGRQSLKLHSALEAERFYRKLGYSDIVWDEPSLAVEYIDLGKDL